VASGRGYLSQSELPVTFGLGKVNKVDRIIIQWPGKNAGIQVLDDPKDLRINEVHYVKQRPAH
jgi:hypothetical protein